MHVRNDPRLRQHGSNNIIMHLLLLNVAIARAKRRKSPRKTKSRRRIRRRRRKRYGECKKFASKLFSCNFSPIEFIQKSKKASESSSSSSSDSSDSDEGPGVIWLVISVISKHAILIEIKPIAWLTFFFPLSQCALIRGQERRLK